MSDKLKVMQETLTRRAANAIGMDLVTYKFTTTTRKNYFVEVMLHEGLLGAINKLRRVFGVDASAYDALSSSPLIQKIEVVNVDLVPAHDGENNFVFLLYANRADSGGEGNGVALLVA